MVQLTSPALVFVLGALNALSNVGAAPLFARQSSSSSSSSDSSSAALDNGTVPSILDACNTARLGVISGLNSTTNAIVSTLATVGNNDPATSSALNTALGGVHIAQGGIATIVVGTITGVTPADTGVPAILDALNIINSSLTSISSTDSNVQAGVANIASAANQTLIVGQTAVIECAKLTTIADGNSTSSSSSSSSSNSGSNSDNTITVTETDFQTITETATATATVTAGDSLETELESIFGFGRRSATPTTSSSSSASQCDAEIAAVTSAIQTTANDLNNLVSAGGSNSSITSAAQTAISGLTSAFNAAPQVQSNTASVTATMGQGFLTAQNALNTINGTLSSSENDALTTAQQDMINTLFSAQNFAIACTPEQGGVAPGK